jgi:hypothetical protein
MVDLSKWKLIAEWKTRGGKYWICLYRDIINGHGWLYNEENGGGFMGGVDNDKEAIEKIANTIVKNAKEVDGINYIRTL